MFRTPAVAVVPCVAQQMGCRKKESVDSDSSYESFPGSLFYLLEATALAMESILFLCVT